MNRGSGPSTSAAGFKSPLATLKKKKTADVYEQESPRYYQKRQLCNLDIGARDAFS